MKIDKNVFLATRFTNILNKRKLKDKKKNAYIVLEYFSYFFLEEKESSTRICFRNFSLIFTHCNFKFK